MHSAFLHQTVSAVPTTRLWASNMHTIQTSILVAPATFSRWRLVHTVLSAGLKEQRRVLQGGLVVQVAIVASAWELHTPGVVD